jgi:hypothetical protein
MDSDDDDDDDAENLSQIIPSQNPLSSSSSSTFIKHESDHQSSNDDTSDKHKQFAKIAQALGRTLQPSSSSSSSSTYSSSSSSSLPKRKYSIQPSSESPDQCQTKLNPSKSTSSSSSSSSSSAHFVASVEDIPFVSIRESQHSQLFQPKMNKKRVGRPPLSSSLSLFSSKSTRFSKSVPSASSIARRSSQISLPKGRNSKCVSKQSKKLRIEDEDEAEDDEEDEEIEDDDEDGGDGSDEDADDDINNTMIRRQNSKRARRLVRFKDFEYDDGDDDADAMKKSGNQKIDSDDDAECIELSDDDDDNERDLVDISGLEQPSLNQHLDLPTNHIFTVGGSLTSNPRRSRLLMGLDDDENDEGRSRAMIIIKKTSPLKK